MITKTGWVMPLDGPVQVVSSMPSSVFVKVASSSDVAADCALTSASPPDWALVPTTAENASFARSPLVFTSPSERLKTSAPADAIRIVGTRRMTVRPSHRLVRPGQREGAERASKDAPANRDRTARTATTARVLSEVRGMLPKTLIGLPFRPHRTRPWQRVCPHRTRAPGRLLASSAGRRRLSRRVWRGLRRRRRRA